MNYKELIKADCKFFKGDIPCRPHKTYGYKCSDCPKYLFSDGIILIIKLAAIGDVIRTTPLVTKLKIEHPNSKIWWLTYTPEIIASGLVDRVLTFSQEDIITLRAHKFQKIINLDKDIQASSLSSLLEADQKFGFILNNNVISPVNEFAEHKYMTGVFDDLNKANTKSYLEEIFEICGYNFSGEEYILDCDTSFVFSELANKTNIIGLNTGCGDRWVSRLWSEANWIKLIQMLENSGYTTLLLGGKSEDDRNKRLAFATGAMYLGCFPLGQFISLMNNCNTIVSAVTMGMHIAIALKKNLILMNNIFNPNEFELYGRGEIISPEKECTCYFSASCKNTDYFCMDYIKPETIFEAIKKY
ncbi:MAG: glycosyltransferase family 9 protein [Candidatus Kapabacteria bacterium]|nr:glycosyltransferase family 9 protein [Candidatus Kapabacteria bacterium]